MVRSHHERWDGTDCPDRLKGQAIPPAARLVAVSDAYDILRAGEISAELRIPVWTGYSLASLGVLAAVYRNSWIKAYRLVALNSQFIDLPATIRGCHSRWLPSALKKSCRTSYSPRQAGY